MIWVKLCGMRSRADVEAARAAGADAVGFVIAPKSPRHVTLPEAATAGSGAGVSRFLVTVDLPPADLLAAAAAAGVEGVQPYGEGAEEGARLALAEGLQVLFPVPVADAVDLEGIPDGAVPLLDTAVPGLHGGSGTRFDWAAASDVGSDFVLAGGLTADTVREAIRVARPWGVDVSSGIERERGVKDPDLMKRFVEAVRGP